MPVSPPPNPPPPPPTPPPLPPSPPSAAGSPGGVSGDGSIPLDELGERIGPGTEPGTFEGSALRARGTLHVGPAGSTFEAADVSVGGARFDVTLLFEGPRLASVDLFARRADDAFGWAGWTREKELERKRFGEAWAARMFGAPLVIKPVVMPELPAPVEPAMPGEEWPRHAVFAWGEVCSYFDEKAGFAGARITYAERMPGAT